jgi:hypothetical protein
MQNRGLARDRDRDRDCSVLQKSMRRQILCVKACGREDR